MVLEDHHKHEVGAKLTREIGRALEKNSISMDVLPEVCKHVLEHLKLVKTREELLSFLQTLADMWPFFTQVKMAELAEVTALSDTNQIKEIQELLKNQQKEVIYTGSSTH